MKHTSTFALAMVCYNTKAFLFETLAGLHERGIVLHWWVVLHPAYKDFVTGEDRKEHWHVELVVKGGYDGENIAKQFEEPDPEHPDKPFVPQCEDKERHIPVALQLESALLYDLHDRLFCLYHPKIGEKPYYDIDFSTVETDSQEWIIDIMLEAKRHYWTKHIHKPSQEDITFAIFHGLPCVDGDKPLTIPLAMKRHWLNSWEFRNMCGMMNDMNKLAVQTADEDDE